MEGLPIKLVVAALGFGLGIVFGATAQRTNFCTMGSISDIVFMGSWSRMRAWLLAIAVAVAGAQAMHMAGLIDLNKSVYLTTNFYWFGAIVGGLLFGFGMTLAGGCGSKTLVRLGAGNLKSLLVAIFIAIFGYMTMRGLIAFGRLYLEAGVNVNLQAAGLAAQGLPDMLAKALGIGLPTVRTAAAAVVVATLLWFCFKDAEFRASGKDIAAGIIIGLCIPAAWAITGVVGNDEFEPTPLASITFVAPVGESVQYLMTFTGATINFGIATVGGVIVGAFLMSLARGQFRLEAFSDANDMLRHMAGGALMGIGGVMAVGCTIGQGLSGVSTLAVGSWIALISIWAGGFLGMKYLEEGTLGGALRAVFARG